jgi:hypothetical protein
MRGGARRACRSLHHHQVQGSDHARWRTRRGRGGRHPTAGPDVVFRFGNADPVTGREAVREAVVGFWSTIDGLTHHIRNVWEFGDTTIVQIDVEYRRRDGKSVTLPNADILIHDGEMVRDWQIYIDVAPVFA